MTQRAPIGPLVAIAAITFCAAGAFAYTAGWLTPDRLTPNKFIATLVPPTGAPIGHRRNHSKGICFTGTFDATGDASAISTATALARGQYPVLGRFNLATANPNVADSAAPVHGMGLRIMPPNGQEWRAALLTAPFFLVSSPQGFYEFLQAAGSKQPDAIKTVIGHHPEIAAFLAWTKSAPQMPSYAENTFHSLDSFITTDASGTQHAIRWALVPEAKPETISADDLAKNGADALEQEITTRVATAPARWTMVITLANPGDNTADPSHAWPDGRKTVTAGTLIVDHIQPEADGPCRDINFDPTILPQGISLSDDPFPAARSAVYRVSYDLRTAEESAYPHTPAEKKP